MPNRRTEIIQVNENKVVFDTIIGKDYRLTVPAALRNKIDVMKKTRITIEHLQ
jgi:hypothetical protein